MVQTDPIQYKATHMKNKSRSDQIQAESEREKIGETRGRSRVEPSRLEQRGGVKEVKEREKRRVADD